MGDIIITDMRIFHPQWNLPTDVSPKRKLVCRGRPVVWMENSGLLGSYIRLDCLGYIYV